MNLNNEKDYKSKLLAAVKKEVKQVMEESVTRKYVHEDSCSVTSLCGAVEACLSQGLRRRALGLFKTSSTTALLHKIAKHNAEAAHISQRVQDLENIEPSRKSSSSSDSLTAKPPTLKKHASLPATVTPLPKYLWIRLALFEKHLAKIIDYLVSNAGKYYDKDALVADADFGNILSSLLVGPCALDYSRARTPDYYWTDPPADELVQRHRISSHSSHSTPSPHRPILNYRRSLHTTTSSDSSSPCSPSNYAKDYVESLHQNNRAALLFGKNNVHVLPPAAAGRGGGGVGGGGGGGGLTETIPGYLSLHQSVTGLTIKWTPNQLMNGGGGGGADGDEDKDKSVYWDYALQVRLDEVVYVHCHQDSETGGTVILVGQDGVQRPPIHFPKGGHMLAFLSCIENGLLPRGRLDPPLWSQRPAGNSLSAANNKKKRRPLPALAEIEETTTDYVFRIIDNSHHKDILRRNDLLDRSTTSTVSTKIRVQLASSSTSSSDSSTRSFTSLDNTNATYGGTPDCDGNNVPIIRVVSAENNSVCIQAVCESMRKQIISRAFYGWLAYCRHLSTVRRHLSGLVHVGGGAVKGSENAKKGLTVERWTELCTDGVCSDYAEFFRLVYYGGVADELRKEIWPYLLGHYKFGSSAGERVALNEATKRSYENTMSEWLAVEAIVKQRDKESTASAIAKLSSESMSGGENVPNKQLQRDLSNEVFEDVSDYDYISDDERDNGNDNDTGNDNSKSPEQKRPKKTKQNTITYDDSVENSPEKQLPVDKSDEKGETVTSNLENVVNSTEIDSSEEIITVITTSDVDIIEIDTANVIVTSSDSDSSAIVETVTTVSRNVNDRMENAKNSQEIDENRSKSITTDTTKLAMTDDEELSTSTVKVMPICSSTVSNGQNSNELSKSSGITDESSQAGLTELSNDRSTNVELLNDRSSNVEVLNDSSRNEEVLNDISTNKELLNDNSTHIEVLNDSSDLSKDSSTNIELPTDSISSTNMDSSGNIADSSTTTNNSSIELPMTDDDLSTSTVTVISVVSVVTDGEGKQRRQTNNNNNNDDNNGDDDDDDEYLSTSTVAEDDDDDDGVGGNGGKNGEEEKEEEVNVIVTNASVDMSNKSPEPQLEGDGGGDLDVVTEEGGVAMGGGVGGSTVAGLISPALSACVSPASSNGGVYSTELLETFGLNLHRIEKDVQRCDRNYWYFAGDNLDKLRNIMCTYVWEHLDIGYMQGMCDLVAPLLVVFNDESLTYACFCHLMERMVENFPNGTAMDAHFANMRSLIQILDAELYELMHAHGDYTHFYFCYRWFLLDFKRELLYPDVFATWEVIWAAQRVASGHFVLFLALGLLETYRDIILANSMDFTDIIKFFNEMAERHNTTSVLSLARDLVLQLQILIENK